MNLLPFIGVEFKVKSYQLLWPSAFIGLYDEISLGITLNTLVIFFLCSRTQSNIYKLYRCISY